MVSPVPVRFNPFAVSGRDRLRETDAVANSSTESGIGSGSDSGNDSAGNDSVTQGLVVESTANGRQYLGSFSLEDCTRLTPLLAESADVADQERDQKQTGKPERQCHVRFTLTRWEKHMMASGTLSTKLQLQCQRCLGTFEYPVDTRFDLVMVPDQAAADELPEKLDPVVLDENGMITLIDLCEDELILQVPTVPKHDSMESCQFAVPVIVDGDRGQEENGEQGEDKELRKNPFEALKSMKFDR